MGGVILENLSSRKLIILVSVLLVCQLACFLIGGIIAPAPYNVMSILSTKCINSGYDKKHWYVPPRGSATTDSPGTCEYVNDLESPEINDQGITPNQIVFAFLMPLPKSSVELEYSRWFQNLIGVLQLDIAYSQSNPIQGNPTLTMDIRLGYRNRWDPPNQWTELATAWEERKLDCAIDERQKREGHLYNCTVLQLFELGSVHHHFYLLNVRLPVSDKVQSLNRGIGQVVDLWMSAIHQNGGFTMVWLAMKSVFFPIIIAIMAWYWRRIRMLPRSPVLLEKMIFALGLALTLLNVPVESLSLLFDMPFMLLLSDIRQGVFYAMLLSFWLIFAGEHLMDESERNHLNAYWKHLSAVVFGCLCLFIFDMCERGVQLVNPFYSIWVTDLGTNLALSFIILAAISACIYFLFLSYMIFQVFRNIRFKRLTISSMNSARRVFYEGIIYRFKFLMLATLLCAALTVIWFIIGQVAEGRWKWDENIYLEYTSAFMCGVYGMWNIYVFALIVLYAPSHKHWPANNDPTVFSSAASGEEIECSHLLSENIREASLLTALVRKAAAE